jgi:hypothetical protein
MRWRGRASTRLLRRANAAVRTIEHGCSVGRTWRRRRASTVSPATECTTPADLTSACSTGEQTQRDTMKSKLAGGCTYHTTLPRRAGTEEGCTQSTVLSIKLIWRDGWMNNMTGSAWCSWLPCRKRGWTATPKQRTNANDVCPHERQTYREWIALFVLGASTIDLQIQQPKNNTSFCSLPLKTYWSAFTLLIKIQSGSPKCS